MKKVNSVKIWSREEIDSQMFNFGWSVFSQAKKDIDSEKYGSDWKSGAYSNDFFSAWVRISEKGCVSVMVSRVKA